MSELKSLHTSEETDSQTRKEVLKSHKDWSKILERKFRLNRLKKIKYFKNTDVLTRTIQMMKSSCLYQVQFFNKTSVEFKF